ncbi:MAG: NAD(P)H-dependent oxidoreductase [Cocleimonas sp.]|nr:NAD(P)H-dependent oxidoreductase [Cocleimonas sp.]
MKITIISGSHRAKSQSEKVARYIQSTLLNKELADQAEIYSLANNPLPLWDEAIWQGDEQWQARLSPISQQLDESDAFVVIAPEYHGQAPAGLKNFFLMWKTELSHKPALLVSVSSVDGGAYPIAELRMSSYKNNRLCYIPEQVIVRHVESVLNDNPDDNNPETDHYFRQRITWTLGILKQYALALTAVRESGATQTDKFTNGM